ncbi:MAG TPA: hypothetical protein DGG94_04345 [Micromonosporaceae bacterium]|nr:hypothetical protein [Micromonosporaceae bacterium]HCU49029.1 hypothetical protein [Micromonosporaceae bacterium]
MRLVHKGRDGVFGRAGLRGHDDHRVGAGRGVLCGLQPRCRHELPTGTTRRATTRRATAKNDFSRLFHSIGLEGRAYGFARDDVNDQSTRQVLPNADPPTSLTISIGC